jgi:hypothetical protein
MKKTGNKLRLSKTTLSNLSKNKTAHLQGGVVKDVIIESQGACTSNIDACPSRPDGTLCQSDLTQCASQQTCQQATCQGSCNTCYIDTCICV